jgi:DNA-binding transcriptional ArsR family regulator
LHGDGVTVANEEIKRSAELMARNVKLGKLIWSHVANVARPASQFEFLNSDFLFLHLKSSIVGAPDSPCMPPIRVYILNRMVQYSQARFDASFAALSDATRRGVLEQLGRADASITDLADKFRMTLTGMKKHVGVLEQAGLVTTEKVGRVRTCTLGPRRLEEEAAWIERYRELWAARFDDLDKVVEELKRKEKVDGRKKRE